MEFRFRLNDDFVGGAIASVIFCAVVFGFISVLWRSWLPHPMKAIPNQIRLGGRVLRGTNPVDKSPTGMMPSIDQSNSEIADGPYERERRKDDREEHMLFWTAFNAIATAIFSALLVVVTYRQWRTSHKQGGYLRKEMQATKDAADAAKRSADAAIQTVEHMKLEQRAWVGILAPTLNQFSIDLPIVFTVNIRNYGRTPAVIIGHRNEIVSFRSPDGEGLEDLSTTLRDAIIKEGKTNETVIPPDTPVYITSDPVATVTKEQMDKIAAGKWIFAIYTRIEYRDVFGGSHFSESCCRYQREVGKMWGHHKYNRME